MSDEFGDRMKAYENMESDRRFLPMLPVCCRLDGKCFHGFTKNLNRPYDECFHNLMVEAARYLVEETNANMGYTQSDEISLVWYSDDYNSQIFFDGRIQKMTSVLASLCSVKFNSLMKNLAHDLNMQAGNAEDNDYANIWEDKVELMPVFDCRVWTVPNLMEATNVYLWREIDATKNAISQAASAYFSHKELMNKSGSEKQEMLFKKHNINFNNYPVWFKRGTYIQRKKFARKFTIDEIEVLPKKHEARSNPSLLVERTEVKVISMPILSKVINRVDVFFKGEEPITKELQEVDEVYPISRPVKWK